jgi:Tol biopolymer transport system component
MRFISSTRVDAEAQFSPDGKKIVFSSNRSGNDAIWVCDNDGSNPVPLTLLPMGTAGSPRWSPDGERVAFDSNVDGQWEVYVVGANGGRPKRLTQDPASDFLASWSGDGKWIYFGSNRTGEYQIWRMPSGGGEAVQVTRNGGYEPVESPDGKWLYYTKVEMASGLWRMSTEGGEESQVLESVYARSFAVVKEGIYFIPKPDSAGRCSIQFFDAATRRARLIAAIDKPVSLRLSVSPDARWILYSQIDQSGSDLMLVENFR